MQCYRLVKNALDTQNTNADTHVRHPALRLAAEPVRQFYTIKEGLTDRPHRWASDRRVHRMRIINKAEAL